MLYTIPDYYHEFSCIAGECEDTCCAGWQIVADEAALKKYKKVTGSFKKRLRRSINWKEGTFKQDKNKRCAFLNDENLCDMYTALGEKSLCRTCKMYPRHVEEFEDVREMTLSVSCPEMARILLGKKEPVRFLTYESNKEEEYDNFDPFLYSKLVDARKVMIDILQDRDKKLDLRVGLVLAIAHDLQVRIKREDIFSVDDVYVIVLFTTFSGIMQGKSVSVMSFLNIPISIILGMIIGLLAGWLLARYFEKVHIRDTVKVLILLSISFLLVVAEDHMTTAITFSALIAVMFLGVGLQKYREVAAKRIAVKCGKMWVAAEVFLFVLVGATVNIGYLSHVGLKAVVLICGALIFRMAGVFVCLLGTDMNGKEKLFTMMAYTPKATVQAAIGGIPLALGFACGDVVLTVAVLAIVLTAPLGAFAIDSSYKKFLTKTK